jgi:hypothetical protein
MKSLVPLTAVLALFVVVSDPAGGATYRWTDDQGNLCLTDNIASVPQNKRAKVQVEEDITTENPDVVASVAEGHKKAAATEERYRQGERERAARSEREEREKLVAERAQLTEEREQQPEVKVIKRRKVG